MKHYLESILMTIFAIVIVLIAVGYGLNVYKFVSTEALAFTPILVVRIFGLFLPPLGGIVGYF